MDAISGPSTHTRAFRFLALPLELREMVYREVIPEEMSLRKIGRRNERGRNDTPHLFLLLAACTQIRTETFNLLRTLKPIFRASPVSMAALLKLFGEQASHIRRVKICSISLGGDSVDQLLVDRLEACRRIMTARTDLEELGLHVRFGYTFELLQLGLWIQDIVSHDLIRKLQTLGSFRRVRVTWSDLDPEHSETECNEWASRLEELLQGELIG
jgi:hypothetical protein